jgi:peroxiredoxin Q/BCP
MTNRLNVGDQAPELTLSSSNGERVNLVDFRGERVIVYFYPKAMTPGCTTEARDFRDSLTELNNAGYKVIGVSPDSVEKLVEFANQESLTFLLCSDTEKSVHTSWGAYGEKIKDGETVLGVIRSIVVVGNEGQVELAQYDIKPDGAVAALRAALGIS